MSHIGVMEAFLKSGAERCLVLEDDALIDASLAGVLHELEDAADAWDMTLLYGNHFGAPLRQRPLGMNHHLVGFFFRQTGAVAYAINRKAAEAYLAHLLPMTLPIDVDYDRAWDFSIRFRGVLPFPVRTGKHASEIGKTGRKFVWYRRFATYLNRMNHGARRLLHYAFTDPIWLTALKRRLAPSSRRAEGNGSPLQSVTSLSPVLSQLKKARS
jgi:glycosyl transferase family 25